MPTQAEIQTSINNLTASNTAYDILQLAAQTKSVTVDRSLKVATVNDLPDLSLEPGWTGSIFFVESLNVLVIADVNKWVGLDERLLKRDYNYNTLWAWGEGSCGRLGDNTTVCKTSPISVAGGFTDWCQVSAGNQHSGGLRTNGTIWAWGCNNFGQLGDNSTTDKSSPVSVIGGFTDWCQISAGTLHSLALRTNGTLWAWGSSNAGRLGDGTTVNKSSPVSVVGGFTDWCQVSGGNGHSVGLRTNGTLWSWGSNGSGQLGDNTTVSKSSPVSVIGGFTDWCQVSGGNGHSVGLRTNGTLWSWGSNTGSVVGTGGQLGDNTTVSKSSPVSVIGGFTDWCQIAKMSIAEYTLALRTNGTAWAWGVNRIGQFGNNSTTGRSSPVSVVGGFTDWCQISAGRYHGLGLRTNGTVWAWGNNAFGQLGDNTVVDKSSPVSVVGGYTDWCQISAGGSHNHGLKSC